jgi:hypothetical protein
VLPRYNQVPFRSEDDRVAQFDLAQADGSNTEQDISPVQQLDQPAALQRDPAQPQAYTVIPHNSKNPLTNDFSLHNSFAKPVSYQLRLPIQPTNLEENDVPLITMRSEKHTTREQQADIALQVKAGMTQVRRSQDVVHRLDQSAIRKKQEQNKQQLLRINIQRTVQNNLEYHSKSNQQIAPLQSTVDEQMMKGAKTDRLTEREEDNYFARQHGELSGEKQIVIKRKNINFTGESQQNSQPQLPFAPAELSSDHGLQCRDRAPSSREQTLVMTQQKMAGGPVAQKGSSLNSTVKKYQNSKQVNTDKIMKMQFKPGSKEPATVV